MIEQIVSASTGMAVWAAVAAGVARPQADLIASVEFASFADVQQKVADLGTTINNPVVSMMAIPALQNALTEKFGNFRSDAPMKFLCYADVAALRRALETDAAEGLDDAVEPVFLFPSADGAAKFLVNHPEAQKKDLFGQFPFVPVAYGRNVFLLFFRRIFRRFLRGERQFPSVKIRGKKSFFFHIDLSC